MAIQRTPMIDDDGSNHTGTVVDNAWKQEFYDQIDAAFVTSVSQTPAVTVVNNADTGSLGTWTIAGRGRDTYVHWGGTADLTVSGIANGVSGDRITIKNLTTNVLRFTHSSASNGTSNIATSAPTPIAYKGFITYIHNGDVWLLVAHEQGAWIMPPFNAANFSWSVEASDVQVCRYRLTGRAVMVSITCTTTTVVGSPTRLTVYKAAYGGFTLAAMAYSMGMGSNAGAALEAVFWEANPGVTVDGLSALRLAGTWAAGTNNVSVYGMVVVEVL